MKDNLDRFIVGQNFGYETALSEIKDKYKRGRWIWYVFPQLRGLGHSPNSIHYGISSIKEAENFLSHPVLGKNLRQITEELLKCNVMTIEEILPSLDVLKVRSCMTLFDYICPSDVFGEALSKFYKGSKDELTIGILQKLKRLDDVISSSERMSYEDFSKVCPTLNDDGHISTPLYSKEETYADSRVNKLYMKVGDKPHFALFSEEIAKEYNECGDFYPIRQREILIESAAPNNDGVVVYIFHPEDAQRV